MAEDRDIISEALEEFRECSEAEEDNRADWLDDMEFARLGKQWPDDMRAERERQGRPCLTFNRMPTFMRQVVNDSRMNRPEIKIHPVDSGADVQTADILNGLIRNIEQSSNADVAYDTAIEHAVGGGFGYFRITTDYACDDSFDLDLKIERVSNPLSVYGDPDSTAADSSDWNRAFVTDWMSEDEFERKYKGSEKSSWSSDEDDRDSSWFAEEMVQVAEWWKREEVMRNILQLTNGRVMGEDEYLMMKDILDSQRITVKGERAAMSYKVTQRIMSGKEVLETNAWAGKYIPIIPVYGDEVNIEGKRHFLSLIRFAKDAQQSFNYWRTSAIEKVALDTKSPWIGPKGAFNTDSEKWATANTKNHPYIEFDGQSPPMRTPAGGVPAGDIQMAMSASDDMKATMGIYDASLGSRSNETSGKAILARQREGDVLTFHFIDNMSRGIRHAGRILVDMIPHIYNTPRILRTLEEDGTPGMVPVNQETIIQGLPKVFDLSAGKYDVTVSSGPSFGSRREEAANQMLELLRAFPPAAPYIGDMLAKNLDWPGADEISKRLKAMLPPQLQDENPEAKQLQQKMQMMDMQAKQVIEQLQQELASAKSDQQLKQAELQLKGQELQIKQFEAQKSGEALAIDPMKARELDIKEYEAQTKRIDVEAKVLESQMAATQADASTALQTIQPVLDSLTAGVSQLMEANEQVMAHISAPRKIVRGPDGRVLGVEIGGVVKSVNRGPDGRIMDI